MIVAHLTASTFFGGPERQMLGLAHALPNDYSTVFISFSEKGRCRPFIEEARRQGISVEALIEKLINERLGNGGPSPAATGAALLEVLRASPYPDIDLTPHRERLPVRDVVI